jgi:hypothetical protein
MMFQVRTTLTIDDDLAGVLQRRSAESGKSFKQVVNDALRRGLAERLEQTPSKVAVRPHDFGPSPGLDFDRLNQLADELEVQNYLTKAARDDPSRH